MEEVIQIPLTQGKVATVDAADLPRVQGVSWYAYTRRDRDKFHVRGFKDGRWLWMHHVILGTTGQVDHRDGDGLNNRRDNLRLCTDSQNRANTGLRKDNSSGFKGVSFEVGRWRAYINFHGKRTNLGRFDSPVEAAQAYDAAARIQHGEFARLNFPEAQ